MIRHDDDERAQGPTKTQKSHANKLSTLGANNFLSKRDTSNFRSDSDNLAKSKLEHKFSALYLLP